MVLFTSMRYRSGSGVARNPRHGVTATGKPNLPNASLRLRRAVDRGVQIVHLVVVIVVF
jgi:hypothetical protein